MATPKVSVIIPTYNRREYVGRAIESVLAQTFLDHEIIVVDDGSTDKTSRVVAAYGDKVRYIYKRNGGSASARNLGIKHAKGRFIAFLDSDDTWLPEKLAIQISRMELMRNVGLSYTDKQIVSEDGAVIKASQGWRCPSGRIFQKLLMDNYISTSSVVVCRRECFGRAGFFDETMPVSQDYEMWLRISYHYEVCYIDLPLTRYLSHPGSISRQAEKVYACSIYAVQRMVELYAGESPQIALAVRKKVLRVHRGFGVGFFRDGKFSQARSALKIAILCDPLDARSWVYFLTTYLGPGPIYVLKRLKNLFFPARDRIPSEGGSR
ncbi:glycosyltransferase [bacterium]|nr:glycosyltransferase [bacterium]